MMRRIILHICRHQTFLKTTFNILQKTKVETYSCNNLLSSFRVFTTPDHSAYSRKDPMNPTFPSLRTVARGAATSCQEGTHWYRLYTRPSCDPVYPTQPTRSFCSTSENSSSIHGWYTGRVLRNIHKPSSDQRSWTAQPMQGHPHSTAFCTFLTTRH